MIADPRHSTLNPQHGARNSQSFTLPRSSDRGCLRSQEGCRCRCTFKHRDRILIIYDNACNALAWLLQRYPWVLQTCSLLVDQFHWWGHVLCSYLLCARSCKAAVGANTVLEEQANVTLANQRKLSAFLGVPT